MVDIENNECGDEGPPLEDNASSGDRFFILNKCQKYFGLKYLYFLIWGENRVKREKVGHGFSLAVAASTGPAGGRRRNSI